jgi:hypothetical protein
MSNRIFHVRHCLLAATPHPRQGLRERPDDIPVLVGGLAANREIYRIGVGCEFDEIDA